MLDFHKSRSYVHHVEEEILQKTWKFTYIEVLSAEEVFVK